MPFKKIRSSVFTILAVGMLAGCGDGIQVLRESENSAIVRYVYQDYREHAFSQRRAQALEKAVKFCGGAFRIVREGPTKSRKRVIEGIGGQDVIEEKWWGVYFRCQ